MVDVSPQRPVPARHLGDGLYAEYDGYQIKLWADRDGMRHEVYLDSGTALSFLEYVEVLRKTGRAP